MTIRDYSTTAANNNAAPPNGWPEGQAASSINDCARQMMAEIRETCEELPYFDFGDDPARVDNDTFTVAGDLTARYPVGARVKLVGATTANATISASSHAAGTTTIDVVMDSGNVPTSLVRVAVNTSGLAGIVSIASTSPTLLLTETDAAANNRNWLLQASAEQLLLRAGNDALGSFGAVLTVDRTGTTVDTVSVGGTTLSSSAAGSMSGVWTFTKSFAGTAPAILMSAANPAIEWNETGGAADNKRWFMGPQGEQFLFLIRNDADSGGANVMTVDRSGTTLDNITFGTGSSTSAGAATMQVRNTVNNPTMSVNTTGNTFPLRVQSEVGAGDNPLVSFLTETGSGTARGSIDFNRAATQVRYNITCDGRLKMAVEFASSALEVLMAIPVRAYRWKETGALIPFGFVAQEVEPVCPEAVSKGDDVRPWGMDYSKMVPILTKALQESVQISRDLTARLAVVEARLGQSAVKA